MNEYVTDELIESTYRFCAKRVSDSEAAKDLAQDILYEALRAGASGRRFVSFYSWYWRMARNKYADFLARKKAPFLPLETAVGLPDRAAEPIEAVVAREELSALNYALSRLSALHREIMTRFYLKEQSVSRIAAELDIPVGTVKSRLFEARKSLRKGFDSMKNYGTFSYAPAEVNWYWGYGCMRAEAVMLGSKICPQVMVLCRKEARSVNELADELGVAPLYLEETLEKMTAEKLLTSPVRGKFLANHCVFPERAAVEARVYANELLYRGEFPKKVTDRLLALEERIRALGFYGSDFPYGKLMWVLYPLAGYAFGQAAWKRHYEKYGKKIPDEAERRYRLSVRYTLPDESFDRSVYGRLRAVSWSCLSSDYKTAAHGRITFCNDFDCAPFSVGRDEWVDGNNISLLLELAENPEKRLTVHEEEKAARFLERGVLKKENGGLRVLLPILSEKDDRAIRAMIREEVGGYGREYADLVGDGIEKRLLPHVCGDLMSNFIYWELYSLFEDVGAFFWYGWDQCLALPEDYGKSAAGLSLRTL